MIHVIDLQFSGIAEAIAAFVVETSEGPVLIETGPYSTYENLRIGLQEKGFTPSDIHHVLLTHIHFDHAGAAWALAEQGAVVHVHPFGIRHLARPQKLLDSARRIYQEDMDRLWGKILPVPEKQLQAAAHEQELTIGDTVFKAWHTPGHAVHHIAWQTGNVLFTGDVAGVRIAHGLVEPPCPPPDIHIEDWQQSIALLRQLQPRTLYLTHFGPVEDVERHLDELEKQLLDWADWIRMKMEKEADPEKITPEFTAYVANQLRARGTSEETVRQYEAANPSWMSVAGLLRYWKKKPAQGSGEG